MTTKKENILKKLAGWHKNDQGAVCLMDENYELFECSRSYLYQVARDAGYTVHISLV